MRVLILLAVVVVLWICSLSIALPTAGANGVVATSIAAIICLFGGASALIISEVLRGPVLMAYGVVGGMLIRMAIPLGMLLVFRFQTPHLMDAGLIYYLLVFYMATLLMETLWALPEGGFLNVSKDS